MSDAHAEFFGMSILVFLCIAFGFGIGVSVGDSQANKHWQDRMRLNQTNAVYEKGDK